MTQAFEMSIRMKDFFFDRASVIDKMGKANARALSKAGAFIRRRARSSIRRRKGISKPGQAPSAHSTDAVATLKNILFASERQGQSLVVGPVKLNQFNESLSGGSVSIPALMEFGGTVSIVEKSTDRGKTWRRADLRRNRRSWEQFRKRRAAYAARPFMGPALEQEADNIPEAWAGSLARAA